MDLKLKLGRMVFNLVPAYNQSLYEFFIRYVDRFNGDNNSNSETNGEYLFLHNELPMLSGGVVFDVGANIGDWMSMALEISPRLQIHCFEPSAATYQRLQARGGAICNNFGLSSAPGKMPLWVFADGDGKNSLYKRHGLEDGWGLAEQQQEETVRLDTLDAYCQRAGVQVIDLMKVDVEGHELEVFKGAVGMFSQGKIKRIQFEYGGCNIDSRLLLKDLFDFFAPYGYSFFKIFPHELRHIPRYDQRLENFQYQNWVAMAPDVGGTRL